MEQSLSREAESLQLGSEFLRILRNQNVRYLIYNSPLLVPILNQINPVYEVMFYCLDNEFRENRPSEIRTLP
jgi:hypothetical protein